MEPPRSETCVSDETSSIISVSNALKPPADHSTTTPREVKQVVEEAEEEEEEEEERAQKHQQVRKDDLILDLSLSSKDLKLELNLVDSFHMGSSQKSLSSNSPTHHQGNETEPRVFSCNYCQRKFYSSQALGGHQNAHKRERTLAKRGQRISAAAASFAVGDHHHNHLNLNRYSSIASLPLHGSLNRSLGIQVHSMIHKPTTFVQSSTISLGSYGQNGWSRQGVIDQQPAVGRLVSESFHLGTNIVGSPSGNNGVARFESARKFSPVREGIGGGYWWDGGVNHLKPKKDELQKLDLSLKL